jgi:hypothetical protein
LTYYVDFSVGGIRRKKPRWIIFPFLIKGPSTYTCNFEFKSAFDYVYDLLPKVSSKLIFALFAEMCIQTILMSVR